MPELSGAFGQAATARDDGTAQRGDTAVQRENAVLRELVTLYRHLSGLAAQDVDLGNVTRLLAERTSASVAVVTPTMAILAASSIGATDAEAGDYIRRCVAHPRLANVLSTTGQARRAVRLPNVGTPEDVPVIMAPIVVGDDVPAYLLALDDGAHDFSPDLSLLITEHAATICGVILGRERVVQASARRVRDDLVEGILLGISDDDEDVQRWARHLGYDPSNGHSVIAVAVEHARGEPGTHGRTHSSTGSSTDAATDTTAAAAARERACAAVERVLTSRAPSAITTTRSSEVVGIVAHPPDGESRHRGPRALSELCLKRIGELFPDWILTIGVGGPCRDPREIARSYSEARRCIDTARRLERRSRIVVFEDLGVNRLLLQVPDLSELRSFAADVLGGLDTGSQEQHAEYLTTLACYFEENNSPQRASKILHVHPNTVAYRVKRVEELTGLRFDSYRDRLMAQVALEIRNALGDA